MTPATPKRPGGRPRGEICIALVAILRALPDDHPGLSFPDLLPQIPGLSIKSPGDCRLVRSTLNAMLQAGELVRCGTCPLTGRCGPPWKLYRLARPGDVPQHDRAERMRQQSATVAEMLAAWSI